MTKVFAHIKATYLATRMKKDILAANNRRNNIIALISYSIITLLVTLPLISNIKSGIYGFPSDNIYQMHDIWFYKLRALSFVGIKPPLDINTIEHDHLFTTPVLDILSTALAILTSPLISYNIFILFGFISAGFFMFVLTKGIINLPWASFVAGLVFSFSPYHYSLSQNHIELSQTEVIPIFGLLLLNLWRERTKKSAVILGIGLGLITLTTNYYGYFLLILSVLLVPVYFALCKDIESRRSSIGNIFIFFTTSILIIAPTYTNYIVTSKNVKDLETITWKRMERSPQDFFTYSARPWFYVLPDIKNPITGKLSQRVLSWISQKPPHFLTQVFFENEHSLYLGVWTILLCIYAFAKREEKDKKTTYTLSVLAFVFLILSAPPYATISGHKIYFPSFILSKILPQFRVYARSGIVALSFLSIVAGVGAKYLLEKANAKHLKLVLAISISLLIVVDMYKTPRFTKLLPLPKYYEIIESESQASVIETPKPVDAQDLFYQMYHNKVVYGLEDPSELERTIKGAKKPVLVVYRKDSGEIYDELINNEKGNLNIDKKSEQRETGAEELSDITIKNSKILFKNKDITLYKLE